MQKQFSIEGIVLLIHPFYSIESKQWKAVPTEKELKLERKSFSKKETNLDKFLLRQLTGVWGRMVQIIEESPRVVLVVEKLSEYARPETQRQFERFKKFAKEKLGNRIKIVDSINPETSLKELIRFPESLNKQRPISIYGMGERLPEPNQGCVAKKLQMVKEILNKNGFESELLPLDPFSVRTQKEVKSYRAWRKRKRELGMKRKPKIRRK